MGGTIQAILGLKTEGFKAGLNQAQGDAAKFKSSTERLLGGMGTKLAGVFTIGAAVQFGKTLLNFAGDLADTADQVGVSTTALQRLQHVFDDTSAENLSKSLGKLNQSIADARSGSPEMIGAFERLGVSWEELHTLTPDQILLEIAAAAEKSTDHAQLFADVLDTMGKASKTMLPQLMSGADAIRAVGDAASVASEETLRKADAVLTRWTNFWREFKTRSIVAVDDLMNMSAKQLIAKSKVNRGLIGDIPTPTADDFAATPSAPPATAPVIVPDSPAQAAEKKAALAQEKATLDELAKGREQRRKAERENFEKQLDAEENAIKAQADEAKLLWEDLQDFKTQAHNDALDAMAEADAKKAADLAAEREGFVEKKLAGPDAAREAKRLENEKERLGKQFDERKKLEARGGKAEADMPQRPLAERLMPRRGVRGEPVKDLRQDRAPFSPEVVTVLNNQLDALNTIIENQGKAWE